MITLLDGSVPYPQNSVAMAMLDEERPPLSFKIATDLLLFRYTDADFATNKDDRRSTSGYIFFLAGGPISWASKRQQVVAPSSTEAKYIGQYNAAREGVWIRSLLERLGLRPL